MEEKTMAQKIKQLRQQNSMTLEEVAQKVGVGRSTVRKWETGMISNMRRDKIKSLADALHTTPEYLMGWEEEKTTQTDGLSEQTKLAMQMYESLTPEQKAVIDAALQSMSSNQ